MSNPILIVTDAGPGTTPACAEAKFKPGDGVRWKRVDNGYIVAAVVPPGFPAEYALADLTNNARPLMITKPSRAITYILVREGDQRPYLAKERDLISNGTHVEIGSVLHADAAPEATP